MSDVSIIDYGLSFQQEQFALEYLDNGRNAKQAALYAGYAFPEVAGHRLCKNVKVARFIRDRRDEQLRLKHMTKDRVLEELAVIAGFDLGEVMSVDADGNPHLDMSLATREHTRALNSFETEREALMDGKGKDARQIGTITKVKIKTHDKLRALQMLADYLGITKQAQVNVQVNLDFGERMEARRLRALEGKTDG